MAVSGESAATDTMLLATIADRLGLLVWAQTKDGQRGINRPALITDALIHAQPEEDAPRTFNSVDAFRAAWDARNAERG